MAQRVFSRMGMLKAFFTALSLCCLAYSVISASSILTKALSAADSISKSFMTAAGYKGSIPILDNEIMRKMEGEIFAETEEAGMSFLMVFLM